MTRWRMPINLWLDLKPLVREQRRRATPAEEQLWQALRRGSIETFRFRRQHPIDQFVVDFYCPRAKLVVEVDGPIHDSQVEGDRVRQEALESIGLTVLRFSNAEVLNELEAVLEAIRRRLG